MIPLGTVRPGSTIFIPFESFAAASGAPITITGLATSDIQVYKDGNTTQRASASGYTLLDTDGIDFDGITGIHGFSIDLSDNTTADFWAAGSRYIVVVSVITVDSQTMSFLAASFQIGYTGSVLDTTIASLSSQTSFTLANGPAEDNALNGRQLVIHDAASAVQFAFGLVAAYTGSTKTVTLAAAPTFTITAKDNVSVMGLATMLPTVLGRTLDVSSGGEAGVDWANVGSPGTTVSLSGTSVKSATDVETDTQDIQARFGSGITGSGIETVEKMLRSLVDRDIPAVPAAMGTGYNPATDSLPVLGDTQDALVLNSDTVLSRLGTFAGSGVNNVLGMFKALLSKTATTPSDVGGTFDPASDSVEAIRQEIDSDGTQIAAIEADTQNIRTRLPAALTGGGNIKADAIAISGDVTAADNAESFFDGTGYAGTNNIIPTVSALGAQAKADVNAEVVDVVRTDAIPELSQGIPSATPTLAQAVMLLYMALRNEHNASGSLFKVRNDSGTVIAKAALSDDGTTLTVSKMASGP